MTPATATTVIAVSMGLLVLELGLILAAIVFLALRVNKTVSAVQNVAYTVEEKIASERQELARRESLYRGDRPPLAVQGRTVILIDDGLATGATMRAAAMALKEQDPQKLVVAVPVSSAETCEEFASEVDSIICAETPRPFYGVGMWYRDFSQTTDKEVRELLERGRRVNE